MVGHAKTVKVPNNTNGFKVMAEVYKALRFLRLNWNAVVSLEIQGGYVELKIEPDNNPGRARREARTSEPPGGDDSRPFNLNEVKQE